MANAHTVMMNAIRNLASAVASIQGMLFDRQKRSRLDKIESDLVIVHDRLEWLRFHGAGGGVASGTWIALEIDFGLISE